MERSIWSRMKVLIIFIFILVLVHAINIALGGSLVKFGIIPRSFDSWFHIFTAPFIHGGIGHLLNNIVGLSIFGALCLMRSVRFFYCSSLFIIIVGGILVWLFGRSSSHIGASGLIFGLWSLSIALAWFDRSIANIVIALLVVFLYGGMFFGVLPTDPRVSFEGHLFGALAGVLYAALTVGYSKRRSKK